MKKVIRKDDDGVQRLYLALDPQEAEEIYKILPSFITSEDHVLDFEDALMSYLKSLHISRKLSRLVDVPEALNQ
jgi:hypothetical protein